MRVIAGSARGHKLSCLPGESIRPTLDRIREAVFSSLTPWLPESKVLDLFGGTGAMGIEALSRGAAQAVFLDTDPRAVRLIEENLRFCRLWRPGVKAIRADALEWLEAFRPAEEEGFDLIFADPPYQKGVYPAVLERIYRRQLLSPAGILVVESPKNLELPGEEGLLYREKEKTYGDVQITYYKLKN